MGSLALPMPRRAIALPAEWVSALALLIAAFAIRFTHFGDPAYQIDEQFYLLVGDRMLHGALPFVDIWDRKPVGLFLVYAAIRLLGGEGIVQYQVVACLFAAITAWIIHRIALPRAGRFGSIAAGLLYLLWIETIEGGGGQSPIFYNPLMAGAAWCVLTAGNAANDQIFRRAAFSAMALTGLAIQIKYTAVFEGLFFGLVLTWWTFVRTPSRTSGLLRVLLLATTALAPTLAAFIFYAAIGQSHAFLFANFLSIFERSRGARHGTGMRLGKDFSHSLILSCCFLASLWTLRSESTVEGRRWVGVMVGWTIFAVIGFASVGMYYYHYLLPLFVPLAIGAAPVFRHRPVGMVMAGVAMWIPFANLSYPDFFDRDYDQNQVAAMMALLPPDVTTGCMHMLEGPPILYKVSNACVLTPYIFPEHLISAVETHAIGVNQADELARVLRLRPRVLVVNPAHIVENAMLRATLKAAYRRAGLIMFQGLPVEIWVTREPVPARP